MSNETVNGRKNVRGFGGFVDDLDLAMPEDRKSVIIRSNYRLLPKGIGYFATPGRLRSREAKAVPFVPAYSDFLSPRAFAVAAVDR